MSAPTIIDDAEYLDALDAEPLTLSGALDDFDLDLLDDSGLEHEHDERHFLALAGSAAATSRRGSFNMDLVVSGRRGSFNMDFADAGAKPENARSSTLRSSTLRSSASMDFQTIQSSLTEMRIDAVQDDEARLLDAFRGAAAAEAPQAPAAPEAPASAPQETLQAKRQEKKKGRRRGQRNRSSSPKGGQPKKRLQRMASVDFDPPSEENMSVASASAASQPARSHYSQAQYGEALQNLAESMKRTEASRRHVVAMRRDVLTPEQRQALSMAKERLAQENKRVQQAGQRQQQGQQQGGGSGMTSGRVGTWRSSLTKNIGMYMGQVNRQML